MLTGIQLIAAERSRQIDAENWTLEHDDAHTAGEMAIAAACYAVWHTDADVVNPHVEPDARGWPWGSSWDKRKKHNVIRRLTIAGALIAAEIDRIQRRLNPQ